MSTGFLQRRKPPRSGIQRAPERVWRRHDQFVKGFICVASIADPDGCRGKVRACHHRTAANSGTGLKPPSWEQWPGCDGHHDEQHRIGQKAFEAKYRIDLHAAAMRLAKISPDKDMRAAMREAGIA